MLTHLVLVAGGATTCLLTTYLLARPTRSRIEGLLKKHSIDHSTWNKNPSAKTLNELAEFVQNGEISIEDHPDRILINHVNVSVVTVIYKHRHQVLELREYRNGHPRPFSGSLGEKILAGESPLQAAKRGLAEELGPTEPAFRDDMSYDIDSLGKSPLPEPQPSDFFPGMFDVYHRHQFICEIPEHLYHNRYTAHENGKQIVFSWVPHV